jgi:hypothetical protein
MRKRDGITNVCVAYSPWWGSRPRGQRGQVFDLSIFYTRRCALVRSPRAAARLAKVLTAWNVSAMIPAWKARH